MTHLILDGRDLDTEGPRGTYGCACVSESARLCTLLRYGRDIDSREQHDDDSERCGICEHCDGTGGDPWNDGITPCEYCDGEGYEWWD